MKFKQQKTLDNNWETQVRNLALPLMTYLGGPRQTPLGGFLWPVALSEQTGSFSFSVAMTAIGGGLCYAAMACLLVFCVIHEFLVGRNLIFILEHWTSWEQSPLLQHNPGTQLTFKASELLLPQPTWSFAQVSLWLISTLSASSVRLVWLPTLSIPFQVTLTSPPYHPFYLFLASAIIWQS